MKTIGKKVKDSVKIRFLAEINKFLCALKSASLPQTLKALPYNKFFTLAIPTYDKSGQLVHPDILYQPGGSPAFMLAFTPYPFSIDRFENPSLVISDDGLHFSEEYPGSNPLAAAPPRDHNNDPDLFYYNGKLCMVYLETLRPERQNLVLLTCSGGSDWSSRIVHTDYLDAGDPMILSPVYVRINQNDYLFYVNMSHTCYKIQMVPIRQDFNPDCSLRRDITINMEGREPWHIDIIPYKDFFYMLICCVTRGKNQKKYDLYIARSVNGYTWTFSTNILIHDSYRATGFFMDDDMYIYYSRQTCFFLSWETGIIKKHFLKNYNRVYADGDNSKFISFDF
jgi:hypothetical protein